MKNIFSFISGFLVISLIAGAVYFYFDLGKYDELSGNLNKINSNQEPLIGTEPASETANATSSPENANQEASSTENHDIIVGTTSSSSVPQNSN